MFTSVRQPVMSYYSFAHVGHFLGHGQFTLKADMGHIDMGNKLELSIKACSVNIAKKTG